MWSKGGTQEEMFGTGRTVMSWCLRLNHWQQGAQSGTWTLLTALAVQPSRVLYCHVTRASGSTQRIGEKCRSRASWGCCKTPGKWELAVTAKAAGRKESTPFLPLDSLNIPYMYTGVHSNYHPPVPHIRTTTNLTLCHHLLSFITISFNSSLSLISVDWTYTHRCGTICSGMNNLPSSTAPKSLALSQQPSTANNPSARDGTSGDPLPSPKLGFIHIESHVFWPYLPLILLSNAPTRTTNLSLSQNLQDGTFKIRLSSQRSKVEEQ